MEIIARLLKIEKTYLQKILVIALPITLQMAIGISLNLVDSLMIGRLGTEELAAVGAANEVFYILSISVYGLCSGASVFIAQYYGMGDVTSIRKIMGINYTFVSGLVLLCSVLIWGFAPGLIAIFVRESSIISLGTTYIRIVALSYLVTCLSDVISFSSRSIQKLKVITWLYLIAIFTNIVFNYLLIYGKMGFPQMGVAGAAIATVIARTFQFIAFVIYIYHDRSHPLAASKKELFSFNLWEVRRVFKMSLPVMFSEGGWSVANALYFIAYGMISSQALAGAQIVVIVGKICQSFFGGFSNAAGILIGEQLGKGNVEKAKEDSKLFIKIVFVLGIVFTVLMYFCAPFVAACYNFSAEVNQMVTQSIQIFALFIMLKMFGYIFVCGILRSGGDTTFCMVTDLSTSWLIAVPAVFIGVTFFHVTLPVAVACVYSAEIVKAALCFYRFKSDKWVKLALGKK